MGEKLFLITELFKALRGNDLILESVECWAGFKTEQSQRAQSFLVGTEVLAHQRWPIYGVMTSLADRQNDGFVMSWAFIAVFSHERC